MADIPKYKYLNGVQQLIYLSDINFLMCQKIYSKFSGLRNNNFWLLTANNAFFESIEILHTLLVSNKNEELRLEPALKKIISEQNKLNFKVSEEKSSLFLGSLIKDYPEPKYSNYRYLNEGDGRPIDDVIAEIKIKITMEKGLKNLSKIKEDFKRYDFHKIRHQTVAHKNKLLSEPAGAANLAIDRKLIKQLAEILKDLRIQSYFWFGYELVNPKNSILLALDELLKDADK